ncbi:MAG: transketolase family protein [Clostridia bacterium]|nr:transketolase family protein [Clostridia bacterium]
MLIEKYELDSVEMRKCYCDALIDAAAQNDKIVAVDADVQYSMGTAPFAKSYPNRAINCGIMEAHGVGLSAGMSATGLIPFFHTFGVFATRRVYDQVFLSAAYQNLNIKIIGGDAGVTATANGGTHMPFEDIGIMRNVPNMTIIEPADSTMYKYLIPYMANTYGNFYMRLCRRKTIKIYKDDTQFVVGKANILREGKDVAIIASGIMVHQALLAADILAQKGYSAKVIDMHTIKPIDEAAVLSAAECGAVVTAANHNIINGLGSAVAEVLCAKNPVPLERVGVNDRFGEVGTQDYLMEILGLTAKNIVEKAIRCIERKQK